MDFGLAWLRLRFVDLYKNNEICKQFHFLTIQKVPFLKPWGLVLEPKFVQILSKLGVSRFKITHQPYVLVTFLQVFHFIPEAMHNFAILSVENSQEIKHFSNNIN